MTYQIAAYWVGVEAGKACPDDIVGLPAIEWALEWSRNLNMTTKAEPGELSWLDGFYEGRA